MHGLVCCSLTALFINLCSLILMQVENTALLTNNSQSDYIGVNLYTDDNAGVYNAPHNHRASEFSFCCGKRLEVCCAAYGRFILILIPITHCY